MRHQKITPVELATFRAWKSTPECTKQKIRATAIKPWSSTSPSWTQSAKRFFNILARIGVSETTSVWSASRWGELAALHDEKYQWGSIPISSLHKPQSQSDGNVLTLWSNAGIPNRHIIAISGHRNEQSLAHYATIHYTATQLLDVLSRSFNTGNVSNEHDSSAAPITVRQNNSVVVA